jgi:hypothetical protein
MHLHYKKKDIWAILFREVINVYSENNTKRVKAIYGQDAEWLNVKVGGAVL